LARFFIEGAMAVDFGKLALDPCFDAFAELAVYQPGTGGDVHLSGIFNRFATEDKVMNTGEMRQVVAPTLAIRRCDVLPRSMPVRSEMVVVGGAHWEIAEVVEDNFGQLLLKLKRRD
jgi:hypothetical protein